MKTLLALISFAIISCAPPRLVPYDFDIEKNNLEAYVEFDSVTLSLLNLSIKPDHYIFGMEIQNEGRRPIFIDTDKMRKHAHHSAYTSNKDEKYLQEVISAMSPDQVNQFFEEKKRNAQAAAAFLFFVGAAISIYDAVQDEKDNSKESWTEKDTKRSAARDAITSTALVATDVLTEVAFASEESAEVELRHLPDELFTKKIIYPGETYYGKILFKKISEVQKYHRIVFPIQNNELLFDFRKATPEERRFLLEQGIETHDPFHP